MMAVRLPVVICQSAASDPAAEREAELVAALMFESNCDLHLIRGLDKLSAGDTDLLLLEGIMGDFVLCGWQPAEALCEGLQRWGIGGRLGGHRLLPVTSQAQIAQAAADRSTPPQRKIFAFDLRSAADPRSVCTEIQRLLTERKTATFTLGGPAQELPPLRRVDPAGTPPAQRPAASVAPPEPPEWRSSATHDREPLDPRQLADLEGLIDQLGDLEL
jgi:hypothetical protein